MRAFLKKDEDDDEDSCRPEEDCLTLSQETSSKNLVEQATALVGEMKLANDVFERVQRKLKDMSRDVERASKSMMYNLEQKIQLHL